MRVAFRSCSGKIVTVLKCTDTRSNRWTPHLPTAFHRSVNGPSFGSLPIPMADPASRPICPPTFNHIPPLSVMFKISTWLGPTRTKCWFMISSGVKCDALDANDKANSAAITNDTTHIDRETRKTVVSFDRSRPFELKGVTSKSSNLEEDPKRGVRSVGSCALRLPLSTWPDNSSLLIVGRCRDGNTGTVHKIYLIQTLLPNMSPLVRVLHKFPPKFHILFRSHSSLYKTTHRVRTHRVG